MNPPTDKLRDFLAGDSQQVPTSCPSWRQLDRWRVGGLSALECDSLRTHTRQCAACEQRLRTEAADFANAFNERRLHIGRRPALRSRSAYAAWALAAASAALIVSSSLHEASGPKNARTQSKGAGSLSLDVFVGHAGRVSRLDDGTSLAPGDLLRFEVRVPPGLQYMVTGQQADGRSFAYYPYEGTSRLSQATDGESQRLDGAAELDGSLGHESIILTACNTPFALEAIERGLPAGCQRTTVGIRKAVAK